jgi:hypothetical protein
MKPITLTLIALFAILNLSAQDQDEIQYLFGNKDVRISGFGAPIVDFSAYDGDLAVFVGIGSAVIFDNKFFIGGYGMGMATQSKFPDIYTSSGYLKSNDLQVSFGHGGLWMGYNIMPKKPIHFVVSLKAGGGAASVVDTEFEYEEYEYHFDYVGVFKPQIDVELNLLRWFKVSFGAGYRYVTGIGKATYYNNEKYVRYFNKNDFNAPYGSVTLSFGVFGPKNKN